MRWSTVTVLSVAPQLVFPAQLNDNSDNALLLDTIEHILTVLTVALSVVLPSIMAPSSKLLTRANLFEVKLLCLRQRLASKDSHFVHLLIITDDRSVPGMEHA